MERNTNKVLLTVIGIAVLIVATVGATFAYFSATGGTATQTIKTGELKVTASSTLTDGTNIKPTTWSTTNMTANDENKDIAKVKLDVVTDGTTIKTGKYTINLTTTGIALKEETDTVRGGSLDQVKWALYDVSDLTSPKAQGTFADEAYTEENGNKVNRPILENVAIPGDVEKNTDTYTLYIWIENTQDREVDGQMVSGVQDRLQGLNVTAKLTVDAIQ